MGEKSFNHSTHTHTIRRILGLEMVFGSKIIQQSSVYTINLFPADLNKACGNTMDAHEAAQMHQNFSQQLLQDHIAACSLPEHNLISVSTSSISHTINSESLHPGWVFKGTSVLCFSGQTASLLCSSSLRMDPRPAWAAYSENSMPQ